MSAFVKEQSEFEHLLQYFAEEVKALVLRYYKQYFNKSQFDDISINNIFIDIFSLDGTLPVQFENFCKKYNIDTVGYIAIKSGASGNVYQYIFHFLINEKSKQIFLLLKEGFFHFFFKYTDFLPKFKERLLQLFKRIYGSLWTIQFVNLCEICYWNLRCRLTSPLIGLHKRIIDSLLFPMCFKYKEFGNILWKKSK